MAESTSQITARNLVANWLASNYELLGLKQIRLETAEEPSKILSAWYETSSYLIDICAWEHAYCLDIMVFEKSSDTFVFFEAGSCDNSNGLLDRLNLFSKWATMHITSA